MAKVTIVAEDGEDGSLLISFTSEPEYKEDDELTSAHIAALKFHSMIEEMNNQYKEGEKNGTNV
mgnify:FL=1